MKQAIVSHPGKIVANILADLGWESVSLPQISG